MRYLLIAAAAALAPTLATATHAAVTISTNATKNENCSGGICTPISKNANLNVNDLQTMLSASDVTVKTGSGAISIGVAAPLTWANKHRLTLDSVQFIHIKAAVVVEGRGKLELLTNDGGSGGDLVFGNGGFVNFWDLRSKLIVNGKKFVLVNDIQTLAKSVATSPAGYFALAKSYDASIDGTYKASPVSATFDGWLDGLGNSITHLKIKSTKQSSNVGLFAQLGSQGSIRDVRLDDVNVSGQGAANGKTSNVAALVGLNAGLIQQSEASGSVYCGGSQCSTGAGSIYVGGLVGYGGSIVQSHANVTVTGGSYSGGLAGNAAVISYSDAEGAVSSAVVDDTGHGSTAGLAGTAGSIDHSFATGAVTNTNNIGDAAGLVGLATTVDYSYATGTVSGATAGGLVIGATGALANSYATGNVSGKYNAGGLAGYDSGPISDSYATGTVSCLSDTCAAGGLAGALIGTVTRSYATGAVSGGLNTGGLIGEGLGGQVVSCFATGTVRTSAQSASVGGLIGLGFGVSLSFATGSVSGGSNSSVGGLVGSGGNIDSSYASGNVSAGANSHAGGLAGYSSSGIAQSYATGSVTGGAGSYLGGLVGYVSDDNISQAYSTGPVAGGLYNGGLVGHASQAEADTYWDIDTSGISNLSQGDGDFGNFPGITGLTDAQLKSALPDGFDPAVWGQNASVNDGLPYLLALPPSQNPVRKIATRNRRATGGSR